MLMCLDAARCNNFFRLIREKNLSGKHFLHDGSVWWIGSYLALSGDISSSRGSKTAEQRL